MGAIYRRLLFLCWKHTRPLRKPSCVTFELRQNIECIRVATHLLRSRQLSILSYHKDFNKIAAQGALCSRSACRDITFLCRACFARSPRRPGMVPLDHSVRISLLGCWQQAVWCIPEVLDIDVLGSPRVTYCCELSRLLCCLRSVLSPQRLQRYRANSCALCAPLSQIA